MGLKNTENGYGSGTKFFHWSIAFLFLFQFVTIVIFRMYEDHPSWDPLWKIMNWHKTSGLLILMLGILRVIWRKTIPLPNWPAGFDTWDMKISHFAEWGLYSCIFLMTITGIVIEIFGGYYIPFFDLFYIDNIRPYIHAGAVEYAKEITDLRKSNGNALVHDVFVAIHVVGAYGVLVFLTAHLTHVFRHQAILKDRLLNRMLPKTLGGDDDVSSKEPPAENM
ncbi:MAG: cytochrome b/b6 domain-containing protein [Myxococcota bacterium]|nr:cytochrome b/b6 domain-containing protein [Myxococcota bacterium]